jgi:DNA-directed RNA polymerase specialized sigma24 family protein
MPHEEILDLVDASEQAEPMTAADRHDLEYALKLLDGSKPECRDYLWNHYVIGFDYGEIAEEQNLNYDNVRMKIGRCLEEAKSLVS